VNFKLKSSTQPSMVKKKN